MLGIHLAGILKAFLIDVKQDIMEFIIDLIDI